MPSFLFQNQEPTIQPYQHPTELMLKAGMYRDAKFKEGLQNIRSRYDNLLSLQLTNPENQKFVRDQLKTAVDQLDKYSKVDISLPENVGAINSVFDPVTDDTGVMQDVAFTQHLNKQKALIEKLSVDDPGKVSPANVFPILQAEQAYRSGSRTARPSYVSFQPYYDFEKGDDEFLTKLKEDIYSDPAIITRRDPATGQIVQLNGERQVKEIAAGKIRAALNNGFDARKIAQMQLDYNYNAANGVYDPRGAITGIEQEARDVQEKLSQNQSLLERGNLSIDQTDAAEKLVAQGKGQLAKLNSIKERIAGNLRGGNDEGARSASLEYYNFGKYLDDYVQQKVGQYSTKQIGKFEANDFDLESWKYQMNANLETLKSQLKAKEGKKGSVDGDTGLQDDGTYEYEPPMKTIGDQIERTGAATVDGQSGYFIPLLGRNAIKNANGDIIFSNTGGGLDDPNDAILIKEASGTLDQQNAALLQANTSIGKTISALRGMDKNYFTTTEVKPLGNSSIGGYNAYNEKSDKGTIQVDMSETQQINKLGEMLTKYQANPNSFTKKAQGILGQLDSSLKQAGVNTLDQSTIAKYNTFIHSDQGKNIIEAGIALNKDSKGRYKFIPEESSNVIGLSDNRYGVSGYIEFTREDLTRMGMNIGKATETGVLTQVPPTVVYTNNDDKAVKSSADTYWMKAVLPVAGDLEAINRRMFEDRDMKSIETKLQYGANTQQQKAYKQYLDTRQLSATQLESSGQGSWRPRANSELGTQVQTILDSLNADKSISPEQIKSIKDQYEQIIKVPSTRFEAMQNLQRFLGNVAGAKTQAGAVSARDFVDNYYSVAKSVEMQTGVPAVLALAQAAIESHWGQSAPGSNFFGIKADPGWRGATQSLNTTEVAPGGGSYKTTAQFRSYTNPADSFRDYARFLRNNDRYRSALAESDPYRMLRGISRAGYATNPNYYNTVSNVMKQIENLLNARS